MKKDFERKDVSWGFRLKKSTKDKLDELNEWNGNKGLNVLLEELVNAEHDKLSY